MKSLEVIVFSMKGCPHCVDLKQKLDEKGIEYYDRDVDEFPDEWNMFSSITKNDGVPSLFLIERDDYDHEPFLYAPGKNYNEIDEAVQIIETHLKRLENL